MTSLRVLTTLVLFALPWVISPAHAADKVKVVASLSILADLVQQIGGDHVEVTSLVGPNTDMHAFQPTPTAAKIIQSAKLVVVNGLGFEGWLERLVKASGYKGPVIVASKGIKPLEADDHAHGSKGHAHGRSDPHAWQQVSNVKTYVANIRDGLSTVDAGSKADYDGAASTYLRKLDDIESEIKAAYADVPKPKRRVITSHDAFTYYGAAYGIEFLAPQGVSGDSDPTAKDVANLIRQIKRERVKAVFVENITNARLLERIAKESGVNIGGTLYSDALSEPGGPASTYIDMMRHNTRLLAAAMR